MNQSHNAAPQFDESIASQSMKKLRILIVAGEPSSDHHGAAVVEHLRAMAPNVEIVGMGGGALRRAGVSTIVDSETSGSIMGITEVLRHIPKILRSFNLLVAEVDRQKPDLAILIDFPDFNLRLAKKLAKRGVRVLYYISPQLWAWRSGRVKSMKRTVTKVAAIFPFEEGFYHRHDVDAEYVGHPFMSELPIDIDRDAYLRSKGLDPARPVVGLLPGSRRQEIARLLPALDDAARRVRAGRPGVQFLLPCAAGLSLDLLKLHAPSGLEGITVVSGEAREVLACSDVAVVASGTATVEAALSGVPTVAVYRLSPLSYRIGRALIRHIQHFAMPNLIAGEKVVDELLQDEVTGAGVAAALERYLGNPTLRARAREHLSLVRKKLGANGVQSAPQRAAEIALELAAGNVRADPREALRRRGA